MTFEEWFKRGTEEEQPCFDTDSEMGWNACKQEVLKILSKPLKNLDLSEDYCEQRYIDKIKEL
jgi:hypothetical protein